DVAKEDGIIGNHGRGEDAVGRGLEAGPDSGIIGRRRIGWHALSLRRAWLLHHALRGLRPFHSPVGPADLAIGSQLVESRVGGRAKVDIAVDDDGSGMNDPNQLLRAFGRETPLLLE